MRLPQAKQAIGQVLRSFAGKKTHFSWSIIESKKLSFVHLDMPVDNAPMCTGAAAIAHVLGCTDLACVSNEQEANDSIQSVPTAISPFVSTLLFE